MKKTTVEKIAIALENKKQTDKALRELRKQKRVEEQAIQTKRHIERGAIAEKLFDPKVKLTNEEFQEKLQGIIAQQSRTVEKPN